MAPSPSRRAACGKRVRDGLDHPRWLYTLPNGDVLVAETNAPPRPENDKGHSRVLHEALMGRAGAGVPSANRITLLRDADGDGVAETRTVFLGGLNSPFGMALVGEWLYVANTDAVLRFPYRDGATRRSRRPARKSADLPAGPINHHWTKNLIASRDGKRCTSRSAPTATSARTASKHEAGRAAILEIDLATGAHARLCVGAAQSQRARLGAAERRAVDGRQRARRARQRPRARLSDFGAGRRLLRLALQLLRAARRHAREAAAARSRRRGDRARLRARLARGGARARVLRRQRCCRRTFAGGAFIGEHGSWNRKPHARLQGRVRAVRERTPVGDARGRADRIRRATTAKRSDGRSAWRSIAPGRCSSPTTSATSSGA